MEYVVLHAFLLLRVASSPSIRCQRLIWRLIGTRINNVALLISPRHVYSPIKRLHFLNFSTRYDSVEAYLTREETR